MSFKIQVSDHDGYCSGNECEYNEWIEHIVDWQDKDINAEQREIEKRLEANLNLNGSGYCKASFEAGKHGLVNHDYRITFIPYQPPMIKSANKS